MTSDKAKHALPTISIRSGGQTGVDRAALDFALRTGLSYGGWCPRGGLAEDYPAPPGLLAKYPCLRETPSAESEQRSGWNVRDSHATLILVHGVELNRSPVAFRSPGTAFTRQIAELVFVRPCHIADVWKADSLPRARDWLARVADALSVSEFVVNVAGPRESEAPRIYTEAGKFLIALLAGDSR
jgi:hypothetical protein